MTLFHYTDSIGLKGILGSMQLLPSMRATNPRDVRYGEGQYLTDIPPGTMTAARLCRLLPGHPFLGRRFTRFLEIDVVGMSVRSCRAGVFLVQGNQPLDLRRPIVAHGVA